MTTLTDFLLQRIAEDEAHSGRYLDVFPDGDMAPLFRRALAECEAKRRIVEILTDPKRGCDVYTADSIGLALAMPYADHPAFREEWR